MKDDVHIATNTMMHGKIYSESRGKVRIGRHSSVRRESMFWCVESIDIGENVIISDHVLIMDNNNHPVDPGERLDMIRSGWSTPSWKWRNSKSAPVVIEDNVWIGKDSKVLKGVTVGENSIIAIGSVVTKDVPRNSVVAGNPAKIVRTLE